MNVQVDLTYTDGKSHRQEAAYSDGGVSLRVAKGAGAAIRILPVYRGLYLPPAGSAYPWLVQADEGAATWTDGVTATILRRLALGDAGFEALNVSRLAYELRNRGGPDPWGVDIDRIVEKLAADEFRSTYINEGDRVDVTVVLPEGEWLSLNPFADEPLLVGGAESETVTLSLPARGGRYIEPSRRQLLSVAFESLGSPESGGARSPGPPVVALRHF